MLLIGWPGLTAQAAERILSFHSDITVNTDASLDVTETITVYAEGQEIKRGIYRDFPTTYTTKNGETYRVGFELLLVKRDGQPEGHHAEDLSNGVRIYIGRREVFLSPGEYTYTISYRTTGQLGFFADQDELYWNVTGNGWAFPIERASAEVRLPAGAADELRGTTAYTGASGSREENARIQTTDEKTVRFETTRSLNAREGLTIVVGFPKGYVTKPVVRPMAITTPISPGLTPNTDYILLILAAVLFAYYFIAWVLVGVNPQKGTIIPLFYPPKEFTPEAIRYLVKMGYDPKGFTAAVIQLAVKGALRIEEDKKSLGPIPLGRTYTLYRESSPKEMSTKDELEFLLTLLPFVDSSLELKSENHERISKAIDKLKKLLKTRVNKVYFLSNRGYFFVGMILSIGFFAWSLMMIMDANIIFLFLFWIGMFFINMLFYELMKAPTLTGRKVMDKIEGFRMFLSYTEKEPLKRLDVPAKTPHLYEAYLPYAIALDVEDKWSKQFTEILAQAAAGGYSPAWYVGTHPGRFDADGFAHDLGHSFSNAIAAASSPPGSDSGFGGGGSSGGGGGGGW